jgi:hypothetical protein
MMAARPAIGDGLALRPGAVVIGGERVQVVLEQHRERDLAHRPGAADPTSNVMPTAPSAHRGLGLDGDPGGLRERYSLPAVEWDQDPRRARRRLDS